MINIKTIALLLGALFASTTCNGLTTHERELVASVLILEAGGEGIEGMQSVMNVIDNRSKRCPKNWQVIATQPHQFSCLSISNPIACAKGKGKVLWQKAMSIVDSAEQGRLTDITDGATHYYAASGLSAINEPYWAKKMEYKTTIGNHKFFYEKGWKYRK